MLIRIHCPNPDCRKELRISAKHAGRKIACTGCHQKIRLPSAEELKLPVAVANAPAAANEEEQIIDFDLMAAEAALTEQVAGETALKETMIALACPMCDEPIQISAEHAGKRAPCPSCRRIIQVPKLDTGKPRDWREKAAQGPSLAKKTEEKLEGAWGNVDIARASIEALEEAKALPRERRKLTPRDWARYGTLTLMVLFGTLVVWWWWGKHRVSSAESTALAAARAALSDKASPPELRAVLQRAMGEWLLNYGGSEEERRTGITHLREVAGTVADPLWVWVLSMDLARLYGQHLTLDPKQTNQLVDPQTLQQLISRVAPDEPREAVVRALCRAVLEQVKGDPEKLEVARNLLSSVIRNAIPGVRTTATAPAGTVPARPPGPQHAMDYSEQLSCLGVLAEEFLPVQARDKALDVIGRVPEQGGRAVYKEGMQVPRSFVAAMTALALPDLAIDKSLATNFELGKMIGHFRAGQDVQGGELVKRRIEAGYSEVNLLPFLELAEVALEKGRQQEALVRLSEAMKIAEIYTERRDQHWTLRVYGHVRLCELTAQAGEVTLAEQRVQKLKLDSDPQAGAVARALIARYHSVDGDPAALLAGLTAKSPAQALAALSIARRQSATTGSILPPVIDQLPEGGVQAAGRLGALLGYKSLQPAKP